MVDAKLLIVGSVALDSIRTPHGSCERVLGGTAVYASCSAIHFAPTAVVVWSARIFPWSMSRCSRIKPLI